MTFDPYRDPLTPGGGMSRELSRGGRVVAHLLRGACSLGFLICAFLVLGLTVNIVVTYFTAPFGLAGVSARIDKATADLGPEDTLLGVEARALVPIVVIAIFVLAVVGLWLFPRVQDRLGSRLEITGGE
jgi:hypothetical protein